VLLALMATASVLDVVDGAALKGALLVMPTWRWSPTIGACMYRVTTAAGCYVHCAPACPLAAGSEYVVISGMRVCRPWSRETIQQTWSNRALPAGQR
jgi:hypothetical protein